MLVSFIIPSYNSVSTVPRCLDSIYALPLNRNEFEVIFVDDCSTDDTVSTINDYMLKYNNLKLFVQKTNHRQGAARNIGVSIAKGKFICFVDSDDIVAHGIVDAIRLANDKQLNMTAFHFVCLNETGSVIFEQEHLNFADGDVFSGIDMHNRYPYWCSAPWAYVYDAEFLREVNYPFAEDVLYEDSDFIVVHLYYAKRIAYSTGCGYKLYKRTGSTTRSITYKGVSDYLLLGTRMLRIYKDITLVKNIGDNKIIFAANILEGACYNVYKSAGWLHKLETIQDVNSFYDRIDSYINRDILYHDELIHRYYWNVWTSIVLRCKCLTIIIAAILQPIYKFYKFIKS